MKMCGDLCSMVVFFNNSRSLCVSFFLPDYILYTYVPVCVYAIFNIDCYISGSRYRITVIIWNRQYIHTVCVRVRFFLFSFFVALSFVIFGMSARINLIWKIAAMN